MKRETSQQSKQFVGGDRDAIAEYVTALEEIYPPAKGTASVLTRRDNRVVVSIPLPTRVQERMRLFDLMAEIGTKLLLETNHYIILSGR